MTAEPRNIDQSIIAAVDNAIKLLAVGRTDQAHQQATEILKQYPDDINAQFVIAAVMRSRGELSTAAEQLNRLISKAPDYAMAWQELGFVQADMGATAAAVDALKRALAINKGLYASWQLLGELLLVEGEEAEARAAFNQVVLTSSGQPEVAKAAMLFQSGKVAKAEQLCRQYLKDNPADVNAIRLLADIGSSIGVYNESETLLERCLELAPNFTMARISYVDVLGQRNKFELALEQVQSLLNKEPDKPSFLTLKAQTLVKMGDFERAIPLYDYLLQNFPPRPRLALSFGHALKTVGRQEDAIIAYRLATQLQPGFGEAWWSLANLKTFNFTGEDLDVMREQMLSKTKSMENMFHLSFALGKALENRGEFEESFRFYQLGNNTKIKLEGYSADENEQTLKHISIVCDKDLMDNPVEACLAADPIFIVGLPRSGSTLLEQILASHSQVDGTKELPEIMSIVRRLSGKRKKGDKSLYPEILRDLTDEQCRELGQEYIDRTRIHRGDAPFFIDKMPNNFAHIGFIRRILPNAKIIDARRHPMAACLSGYTQLFAKGQSFTYGLKNMGRYYKDYLSMMDHWDGVFPGKVLLMEYEAVVADTENQVRRLLDHCGLPFEKGCLHFYQTERAVRTASSEQVRQPIYSAGLEHWKNYQPFLEQLQLSLGDVLERYP
jgi:tetratricopeptide (TPR) repeat protein